MDVARQIIANHPASLRKIYPDRQINNIYFDTPSLTAYHENVMGIAQRKKFRVRWYGADPQRIENPQLEIKIKDNQLGRKEVYPVSAFQWDNLRSLNQEVQTINQTGAVLRPALVNAYRRAYFGTANGHFRITLDWQLRYFSLLEANRFTRFNVPDADIVVELKYDEIYEAEVDRIRQYLPFRQTKSSKYVSGMNLVGTWS